MKKLFLFTCLSALALTFNSCSGDDPSSNNNGPEGTLSFKLDGVQKTFNTIAINENVFTGDGVTYTIYGITASDNSDPSELVYFTIEKTYTGTDSFNVFRFTSNNIIWYDYDLLSNTMINRDDKLKGSFSGSLYDGLAGGGEEELKIITDGTFDIDL